MPLQDDFNENADEWFALENGSYPAVPRAPAEDVIAVRGMLPLVIRDTGAFRAQADIVEAALLILSQSPHARALAQAALKNNYAICIDNIVHDSGRVESHGHTDHLNRRIYAVPEADPVVLALRIAHELAHVAQAEKGFEFSVLKQTPQSAIRELMALEGDARAHEFIVALELAYKTETDPAQRLLFPQAIDAVMETLGGEMSKKLVAHFRPQFPDIDRDEMMARVFKSFYAAIPLRAHYEASVLYALQGVDAADAANPALFAQEFDSAQTLQKLGGYAQKAARYLDLDSPQMAGITQATHEQLAAWQLKRDTTQAKPAPRKAPSP
ncbi:MAG: hypothetical protein IT560_14115 [Alphaproteobacteria bacterium]|nr:hypothetical protein [Alphaproteobacteria bacterium]